MQKSRSTPAAFNPEKFLATDAKKKSGGALERRLKVVRPVIVLADTFKKALYRQLREERPELFIGSADIAVFAEAADALEGFLRRAISKEGLKFGGEVFAMLYRDFLQGLSSELKFQEPPDSAHEPKA